MSTIKLGKRTDSAFTGKSIRKAVDDLIAEIQELYLADAIPWVVGYSGGKDSTATLQLVWMALALLKPSDRSKPVHVISTDTLVENPIVAAWVNESLSTMREAASQAALPITPHRLTPAVNDTFWVNLIGRGYPAPRPKFRWCTERLKIKPSNQFINNVVRSSGEAILVLGTRKAESQMRAATMNKIERLRVRDRLSPNLSLPNSLVFSPIEDWTNDDVWMFLMQFPNPWDVKNKDLLTMYQGASEDGECPLVVDASTPSCGDSRFGCWVCTMVERDKSMHAMITNDEEKEWMLPLLELRNELGQDDDRHLRDFRRITGAVQLFHDRTIPGPYKQSTREHLLRRVLEVEKWVRQNGPQYVRSLQLVSMDELREIRRIWVIEKHETEDRLPVVYEEVRGEPFPEPLDDGRVFGAEEMALLKELCAGDELHYELTRHLLDVEWRFRTKARRAGLFDELEAAFEKSFYDSEDDATDKAKRKKSAMDAAQRGEHVQLALTAFGDEKTS